MLKTVLTIAGSDSSGGAGIQADLKTISALGCYGASVITAITAQNTVGVRGIAGVPIDMIIQQMQAVFDDMDIHAIKIGMLFSKEIIQALLPLLDDCKTPIVLDPVMISSTGQRLLSEEALETLKLLFPLATLLTPNIQEAALLANLSIKTHSDMLTAGLELLKYGSQAVLIKGGHLAGHDCLVMQGPETVWFEDPLIQTPNTHGTGCTYSSAIATYLAKGFPLEKAVRRGKQYVYKAILAAKDNVLGKGCGPVHHFHPHWSLSTTCDL